MPVAHRFTDVIAAALEEGDVEENEAAAQLAAALKIDGVDIRKAATGRVNIHAGSAGLFVVDKIVIDTINRVDPAVTIGTLAPFEPVQAGQMVATVKIIPFAVAGAALDEAMMVARHAQAFAVHPFEPHRVTLIQTTLASVKSSVLDKTARVTGNRLARSGSTVIREIRIPHDTEELTEALMGTGAECDLVLVFGASALCDWDDVIPAAIRRAGGYVERAGMPVDPGNLFVLGQVGGRSVIGAPGCARSLDLDTPDAVLKAGGKIVLRD